MKGATQQVVEHRPVRLHKRQDGVWEAISDVMGHAISAKGVSAFEADQELQKLVHAMGFWTEAWA